MRTKLLCVSVAIAALLSTDATRVVSARGGPASPYRIIDLGTLGGTYSFAYAINDAGVIAGGAATPAQTDFLSQTAFISDGERPLNLGTVGGSACPDCSSEAAAVSASGRVAVLSETAAADANGEDFCDFGTHRQCVAAVWRNGVFRVLPMLPGGHNSQVLFANNAGEMVGTSETGQADIGCVMPFQQFRYQAVKWNRNGQPTPLAPLPGDTVSFAFSMNDRGQVVGSSGLCSNVVLPPNPQLYAPHAVLWDVDGTPIDLGVPAGASGLNITPTGINNRGDIVLNSQMTDGTIRAFVWTRSGGLRDLGTYPQDALLTLVPCCNVINDHGQVVGFSIDTGGTMRALLWQNGVAVDLNMLVPADSPWDVTSVGGINDAGEIAGVAVNRQTSEVHAVLLSPSR
jgi:probable HAF family extracellular repeat protein